MSKPLTWADQAVCGPRIGGSPRTPRRSRLVKLGQLNRARDAVRQLLEVEPELTISGFFTRIPVPLENMAKTYADTLKIAGLPA